MLGILLVGGGGTPCRQLVPSAADRPLSLALLAVAAVGAVAVWRLVSGRTQARAVTRVAAVPFLLLVITVCLVVGIGGMLGLQHFGCIT